MSIEISALLRHRIIFPYGGFAQEQVRANFEFLLRGEADLVAIVSILLSVLQKEELDVSLNENVYRDILKTAEAVLLRDAYCS